MLYQTSDERREYDVPSRSEPEPYRSEFRQDYGRLIHSACFRRLVGKTQLFPSVESDFFRNRLTHSIEVAQIAKSIAARLNHYESPLKRQQINTDLVEMAGLAHDLGHPPFGHNGEEALDQCMHEVGGFEGNAQTLRLLARIEKKVTSDDESVGFSADGQDKRYGLNLTARSLASVLKYDQQIPFHRTTWKKVHKGYYASEVKLVRFIKKAVCNGAKSKSPFKTIECYIMDLADDIAYSTYDLEDTFKASFMRPMDFVAGRDELMDQVSEEVNKHNNFHMSGDDVREILYDLFFELAADKQFRNKVDSSESVTMSEIVEQFSKSYRRSIDLAAVGYIRTKFTSALVGQFIQNAKFKKNAFLPLSEVYLEEATLRKVEVLKRLTYVALIKSARLKLAETRGKEIVEYIFKRVKKNERLLPDDFRAWYDRGPDDSVKRRVICDFIAGMTDRYAVEFYSRLRSENPATIFKPH